jgi:Kef-type K+ transport system membrane component KefB
VSEQNVTTGITFDLAALLADPILLLMLPLLLVVMLVIRGLPSMLAAPAGASRRDRVAVAFFGATALPIIVAVTAIGVDERIISSGMASVLVGAGMLSVLLFPRIASLIRREPVTAMAPLEDDLV